MSAGGLTLPYSGILNSTSDGIYVENIGNGRGIFGKSKNGAGVRGESETLYGVVGASINNVGVYGFSTDNVGVYAESVNKIGLYSYSTSNYAGVFNGSVSIYNYLKVGNKVGININGDYPIQPNSVLHIKGDNSGWNSHIRLESSTSTNYGLLIYDGQGMKFRTNVVSDGYYFMNSANNTAAYINHNGDLQIDGKLTSNGKGNVVNYTSSQVTTYQTSIQLQQTNLSGHSIVETANINFGVTFNAIPKVTLAQVSSPSGQWQPIVITPFEVTNTGCKFLINNTSNTTVSFSGTWELVIYGVF